MDFALQAAKKALLEGEVPVGCCIKFGDCKIQTYNMTNVTKDPLNHCELEAIKIYISKYLKLNKEKVNIYITLEPCTMCCRILNDFMNVILHPVESQLYFGVYNEIFGNFKIIGNKNPNGICLNDNRCIDILKEFYNQKNPRTN